jgi:DNA-binding NarL/FixJ family response regulator
MHIHDQLTSREHDVMARVIRGSTNREIAQSLVIAECTVEAHLKQIYRKLGVHNRTEATFHYLRDDAANLPVRRRTNGQQDTGS